MNARLLPVLLGLALFAAAPARAIDRDARFIDTLGAAWVSRDGGDTLIADLWGETVLRKAGGRWAILAGGGLGQMSPDGAEDIDLWQVGLGLKRYLTELTSLALIGTYTEFDVGTDPNIRAGTLSLKHRLVPASDDVSPYLKFDAGVESVEHDVSTHDDRYMNFVGTLGAGCDFMCTETLAFGFEGGYFFTEDLSNDAPGSEDGWFGILAVKAYWPKDGPADFFPHR